MKSIKRIPHTSQPRRKYVIPPNKVPRKIFIIISFKVELKNKIYDNFLN